MDPGSFGTYPRPVQQAFRQFQDATEAEPDPFIRYEYPVRLDQARVAIAELLNAPVSEIVFVPNATTATNVILRNLVYHEGDVVIYFATVYGALERTIEYVTETTLLEAVKIDYTYPVSDRWMVEQLRETIQKIRVAGKNPIMAIYDTVVSNPGVRMPFEQLTQVCKEEKVLSCLDGAHGAGMLGSELDLSKLQPDFFLSNCHK
jgi:selenocysteine lyase/cysteine desulfurase